MAAVGVRELKSRLSHYLSLVQTGETVVITEHGRPIGRIVPLKETAEARIADLIEAGLLDWSGNRLATVEAVASNRGPQTIAELLVEDRGP